MQTGPRKFGPRQWTVAPPFGPQGPSGRGSSLKCPLLINGQLGPKKVFMHHKYTHQTMPQRKEKLKFSVESHSERETWSQIHVLPFTGSNQHGGCPASTPGQKLKNTPKKWSFQRCFCINWPRDRPSGQFSASAWAPCLPSLQYLVLLSSFSLKG